MIFKHGEIENFLDKHVAHALPPKVSALLSFPPISRASYTELTYTLSTSEGLLPPVKLVDALWEER